MDTGIVSILIFYSASIIASVGFVVFLGSKSAEARSFSFMAVLTTFWVVSHGFFHASQTEHVAYLFVRLNFFLGTLIAMSFFYFAVTFYNRKHASWQTAFPLVLSAIVFFVLFFGSETSHMILSGVIEHPGFQGWEWSKGPIWYLFELFFVGFWLAGMVILFLRYQKSEEKDKIKSFYMIVSMAIGLTPPFLMNIFLPSLGYFALDWLGALTSFGWVFVLGYSIVKHNQMNTKTVTSELLVIAMMLLLFFSIFI